MTIRDHLSPGPVRRRLVTIAAAGGIVASLAFPALGSGPASAATSAAAGGSAPAVSSAPGAAGAQLWASRYGTTGSFDFADGEAVSPADGTVFVTGWTATLDSANEYTTIAYDPATGHQLWVSHYKATGSQSEANPAAITVSPNGGTVFVTGTADVSATTNEFVTVAYDAATGAQLWVQRFSGGAKSGNDATALVVSHDSSAVYVTGYSGTAFNPPSYHYVTIGYNAVTGAQLWNSGYTSGQGENNQARSIAISPDDQSVYVTGRSLGKGYDDATIAYNAATGDRRWVSRYNNSKANGNDFANDIAVSPGGRTVVVTGGSAGKKSGTDFATVAYNAATGAQLWASRYNGPGNYIDAGTALAITPNGATVVVTGSSSDRIRNLTSYTTIAYNARTGVARWTNSYPTQKDSIGGGGGTPVGVVISPAGTTAYVSGLIDSKSSGDNQAYGTVAYSLATGARQWVRFYLGSKKSINEASSLALSPSGNALYVTGGSTLSSGDNDYATVAYRT
jgi:PQQ-like domain